MTRTVPAAAAIALSAVLAACGTPTPPAQTTLSLSGTAAGVSFPPSVVYLASGDTTYRGASGTLTTPAAFTLDVKTAPDAATAFDLLTVPAGCTVSGAAQAHPRVHFFDRLIVASPQGDALGSIREKIESGGSLPFSRVARVYSDRAATVKATVKCGTTTQVNYDVTLRKGWNAVEYADAPGAVTLRTLGTVTTSFQAEPNLPYISVVFAPSTLTFTTNPTFQVSATFYQEGGAGGTFPLNVDAVGLSVEPAEITIPALAVQGMRPGAALLRHLGVGTQAVTTTLTFTYTGTQTGTRPFVLTLDTEYGEQAGRGDGILDVRRP